ncbi:MAG: hypothetical protein LBP95_07405 [Deltaproteobacteria bacterium]|jgi:hypothetical protein|nr:hypothetical protein [Deltaproteobacteria bacterium]
MGALILKEEARSLFAQTQEACNWLVKLRQSIKTHSDKPENVGRRNRRTPHYENK